MKDWSKSGLSADSHLPVPEGLVTLICPTHFVGGRVFGEVVQDSCSLSKLGHKLPKPSHKADKSFHLLLSGDDREGANALYLLHLWPNLPQLLGGPLHRPNGVLKAVSLEPVASSPLTGPEL